ncbi:hypothetical protein ACOSQ4_028593 [Xanthoceras sorbifolium]
MRSRGNQIRPNQWNKGEDHKKLGIWLRVSSATKSRASKTAGSDIASSSKSSVPAHTVGAAVGSNVDGIQLSDAATLNKLVGILHVGRFWKRKLRDFRRVL